MQQRSHPFFSAFGCGTAFILAIVLVAILVFKGGGPFSPGPLLAVSDGDAPAGTFTSHAEFEQDCGQCHAPWQGIVAERCEQCHTNVADQRTTQTGLHGTLIDTGRCQICHTDHKGRDAEVTQLALLSFDHERLIGFSLAHHELNYDNTPMACEACHTEGLEDSAITECVACHQQAEPDFMVEHTTLFGDDCLACHDGQDSMADFDHAQFFVLDGRHAAIECQSCHLNQQFAGTPQECVSCHEEPTVHAGLFGLECARCHTAAAWTPAQLTQHTFPLDHGGQGIIACETCHEQSYTVYSCYNCHEHDPAGIREEHIKEDIFEFEDCVECHPTGLKEEGENEDD